MIDAIKTAMLTVTNKTYHYWPPENTASPYIVWAEDGQGATVWADGAMQNQVITGTVDYFTKTENDANVGKIQAALNGVCSWRLNSVQYEDELIHHEWAWEIG